MFCHNIHSHFTEKEVCADPCGCCNAGCLKNIQNNLHCEVVGRQLIGVQIVSDIHEHFVDGIYDDVLRCNILQVDIVNPGAVFHVIGHAWRGDNEVNREVWVFKKFRMEAGGTFQLVSRSVMLPSGVGLFNSLLNLKQTATA